MNKALRIAFLGTGLMGQPMCRRLLEAGHSVAVWNRSAEKCSQLTDLGAVLSPSPASALQNCDVAISMLAFESVIDRVLFQSHAYEQLSPGSVLVEMSSLPPACALTHAKALLSIGVSYVDAPVSGGTKGATEGTLSIFAGGSSDDIDFVRPVLAHLGTVFHMGDVGSGQMTKLANQIVVAGTIGAVAEGLAFAKICGMDMRAVREALLGGFAESRVLQEHGKRMVVGNFVAGAPNEIFLKDLDNIQLVARDLELHLPIVTLLRNAYDRLIKKGKSDLDHASLILEFINTGGLPTERDLTKEI